MSYVLALQLLDENIEAYIGILIGIVTLYFLLFRKKVDGCADPLFFAILNSALASSTAVFVIIYADIKPIYSYSFFLTQIAFVIGLLKCDCIIEYKENIEKIRTDAKYLNVVKIYFLIASSIYVFFKIIFIYNVGLPILLGGSRLGSFSGWGALTFFELGIVPLLVIIAIANIMNENSRIYKSYSGLVLLLIILSGMANGTRTFFLYVLVGYYYACKYILWLKNDKRNSNSIILLFFLLTIFTFLGVSVVIYDFDLGKTLISTEERLFAQGDIYCYFYMGDYLLDTNIAGNMMNDFITPLMAQLRIVSRTELPAQLGLRITSLEYGYETVGGPNNRINVLGLIAFGFWGSIVFSYCIGRFVAWCHNKSLSLRSNNAVVVLCVYACVMQVILFSEQDLYAMLNIIIMSNIINAFLLVGALLCKIALTK